MEHILVNISTCIYINNRHEEKRHTAREAGRSGGGDSLMLSAAMPPWGAAGYMEGMLVVMKSAICCRASRLVGVLPVFIWSWIMVSSSSQNACRWIKTESGTGTGAADIQERRRRAHTRGSQLPCGCGLSVVPSSTHAYTWLSLAQLPLPLHVISFKGRSHDTSRGRGTKREYTGLVLADS